MSCDNHDEYPQLFCAWTEAHRTNHNKDKLNIDLVKRLQHTYQMHALKTLSFSVLLSFFSFPFIYLFILGFFSSSSSFWNGIFLCTHVFVWFPLLFFLFSFGVWGFGDVEGGGGLKSLRGSFIRRTMVQRARLQRLIAEKVAQDK